MKQEFYKLANEVDSSCEQLVQEDLCSECAARKKCRQDVLNEIRKEKKNKKQKRLTAAAACLAVIAAATVVFHNEVQAAIERIRYSLSMALERDVSHYSEDINASANEEGYKVTLQEAIAAREELIISYTVQREDGRQIELDEWHAEGKLFVNGTEINEGSGGSIMHLDHEQKILGCEASYRLPGVDLYQKNKFEIKFKDPTREADGNWDFSFEADGSQLYAETTCMQLGTAYTLPDGTVLTLDELFVNELSEQITFRTSTEGLSYQFELLACDERGREAKFTIKSYGTNKGVMENIYNREDPSREERIDKDSKSLTARLYIYRMPEEDGQITNEGEQVGNAVTWDLTKSEPVRK